MKWLSEAVQEQVPRGTCVTVPPLASEAFQTTLRVRHALDFVSRASPVQALQPAISFIQDCLAAPVKKETQYDISEVLGGFAKHNDRTAVVEKWEWGGSIAFSMWMMLLSLAPPKEMWQQ